MSNNRPRKQAGRAPMAPSAQDQARDELFSHILRCGVLEAEAEHQKEWMDDTMQYLADRYTDLTEEQLAEVRVLGERYCRPVVARAPQTEPETVPAETV